MGGNNAVASPNRKMLIPPERINNAII